MISTLCRCGNLWWQLILFSDRLISSYRLISTEVAAHCRCAAGCIQSCDSLQLVGTARSAGWRVCRVMVCWVRWCPTAGHAWLASGDKTLDRAVRHTPNANSSAQYADTAWPSGRGTIIE